MTIHIAKGLEFPYVFLTNFNDGILPNHRSLEEGKKRALEEERRLAYVAVTRAEKEFYMTESEGLTSRGIMKYPSRFIFEIKEHLFDREGLLEEDFINESLDYIERSNENIMDERIIEEFQINQDVIHPIFGVGRIKSVDQRKRVYQIKFQNLNEVKSIRFDFKGLKIS